MVQYRRSRVPGGTYFFTVTLADRHEDLLITHVDLLRDTFRQVAATQPFRIDAIVVLPDHLHALWTLPPNDSDYAGRWRAIKSTFVRLLSKRTSAQRRTVKGEALIWQRRFWEHTIRDDHDFETHVDYIHFNPVKHGLCKAARDWPHSSFHRYVGVGLRSRDWAESRSLAPEAADYGERRPIQAKSVAMRKAQSINLGHSPDSAALHPGYGSLKKLIEGGQ